MIKNNADYYNFATEEVLLIFTNLCDKMSHLPCIFFLQKSLVEAGNRVAACFREVSPSCPPISDLHTECLYNAVTILMSAGLGYPRFFFQSVIRFNNRDICFGRVVVDIFKVIP